MGRWAQRRVRGGGGGAPPPPVPITITSVVFLDALSCEVNFSAAVTGGGISTGSGFQINGVDPNSCDYTGPTVITLGFAVPFAISDPWVCAAQPDWLTTLIEIPESGVVV